MSLEYEKAKREYHRTGEILKKTKKGSLRKEREKEYKKWKRKYHRLGNLIKK